jgi:ABC-type protease/lipase transport system fused ATPase/permease subunit
MPPMTGFFGESVQDVPWWAIFLVVMFTFTQLLLLVLILVLANKLNSLVIKMDSISQNAGKFLRMGMTYFRKKP